MWSTSWPPWNALHTERLPRCPLPGEWPPSQRPREHRVAYREKDTNGEFRARFKRPDGTQGSKSGFPSAKAAKDWGDEQEALIRRNLWIDNRKAETLFGPFATEFLEAISPRLERGTLAKYQSHLNNQLLPQWQAWPVM